MMDWQEQSQKIVATEEVVDAVAALTPKGRPAGLNMGDADAAVAVSKRFPRRTEENGSAQRALTGRILEPQRLQSDLRRNQWV
ncbi:MAG: hypothetical protein WDN31_03500 [Hyphomicrobium sp.]